MKQEVKPAEGKLGIMVVGCGAVATTFMTGVLMVRKGLSKPVGSMTQYDKIRVGRGAEKKYLHYGDIVPLAKLDDIVFGTWDAYPQNAYQAAVYAEVLKAKDIEPVRDELDSTVQVDPFPSREGNLKRRGRETSREKSSGRPQGKPHERNPQRDHKGEILRETSRVTSREKSSGRPQGRTIPVGAAPKK